MVKTKSTKSAVPKAKEVSLKDLLEAGVHFGHQSSRWYPKMKSYLFGIRDGVHVFDLVKTKDGLEKACQYLQKLVAGGGEVLFVGTKRQAKAIITEEAKRAKSPYVSERWLGGTLTNFEQVKKSLDELAKSKEDRSAGNYKEYTKKEQLLIDRKIAKLESAFGGLSGLTKVPEAIFVVDVKKEELAIKEAKIKSMGVVGLVDSNSDPRGVDFVIPGNDDAVGSIKAIVTAIADAVLEGKNVKSKSKSN